MPPFSPGDRVVVLGAGSTRDASWGAKFQPQCDPPLNSDFFTQLQRLRGRKYAKLVRDVIKDVVDLFGPNFDLTLEDYFTQLEFLDQASLLASRQPKRGSPFTRSEIRNKRRRLYAALSAVLEVSTDAAIRRSGGCARHARLAELLRPKDVVISFNYDCVMDHALRTHAEKKRSARYGYGFENPGRVAGVEHWDPTVPAARAADTVYLLKLHGSMNWQFDDDPSGTIKLKQRLYGQKGVPRFEIIPPEWSKRMEEGSIFEELWRRAHRALRSAKEVAVVGFSFARTDTYVEALFRTALAESNLKTLVVVNPDRDIRRRVREVASPALRTGALVRQYDHFRDFVDAYDGAFG